MKYILLTSFGFFIGSIEDSNPIIYDFIPFKDKLSFSEAEISKFINVNKLKLFESLKDKEEEVVSDNSKLVNNLRMLGFNSVRFAVSGELKSLRGKVAELLKTKFEKESISKISTMIRDNAMDYTRSLLKEKVEARDIYMAQAINSIDDINAILNLIYARLSEWYGIHFPELQELVRDNDQYIQLISKTNAAIRSELTENSISHLSDKRREYILNAALQSLGSEISPYDMKPIGDFANFGVEILKVKESLESYIDESMKEVAPNIQKLVGSLLGARLIALAGSLENLAKVSSGTIQVLGAEKALFRHLRSGEDPPKHGVLFQSPYIHSAKKHIRGKIARALAGKLSIAARVDYFSGEFIGDTLLNDLEERIKDITDTYPEPSARQLEQKLKKRKPRVKQPWQKGKRSKPRSERRKRREEKQRGQNK